MKGRILALGTLAVVVATLMAARGLIVRRSQHDDSERAASVGTLTADAVGDWFWWHRQLPKTFAQIEPYFRDSPHEWVPEKGWTVRFSVSSGTDDDVWYGGRLALMKVTVLGEDGKVLDESENSVDLRDPDRLWKPHYTELGPSWPGGLAKTACNRAAAVADAVWAALDETGRASVTQAEVEGTADGARLRADGTFAGYPWRLAGATIQVTETRTGRRYDFPRSGPASVNAKVANAPGL